MPCDVHPLLQRLQDAALDSQTPDALADAVVALVAEALPQASWTGIYWLRGDTLHLGPFRGPPTDHVEIPVGRGVCGTAIAQDRDQAVPDVRKIVNYLSCAASVRSELVVLIRSHGRTVGQIDLDAETVDAFDEDDHCMVRAIADCFGALLAPTEA